MKMLFSENHSSSLTMLKVGQGTQKVKKFEMSHYCFRNTLQKVSVACDEYFLSYSRKSVVLMFPNEL